MSSDGGNEAATGWGNKEQIIYCQNGGANPGTTTTQGFYRIIFQCEIPRITQTYVLIRNCKLYIMISMYPGTGTGGTGGTTGPTSAQTTTTNRPLPTNIVGCIDELPENWQASRCHSSMQQGAKSTNLNILKFLLF